MHGIIIKRLGHNVHILEQNSSSFRDGQAAGISAGPQVQEFLRDHDLSKQPYSVFTPALQFLDKEMNVEEVRKIPFKMTSWNVLYYRLRANFDGFVSEYCPKPPERVEEEANAVYDVGKRVANILDSDGLITVDFDDLINGGGGSIHADLVIAADGSNSSVRQLLQPGLKRPYAGYVAWRGTIAENDVSEETKKAFDQKTTFFVMDRSYIVL